MREDEASSVYRYYMYGDTLNRVLAGDLSTYYLVNTPTGWVWQRYSVESAQECIEQGLMWRVSALYARLRYPDPVRVR